MSADGLVLLRAAGVALLVDARGPGLPAVLHWGADPGGDPAAIADALAPPAAQSTLDTPMTPALLPERAAGHRGRPGLSGARGSEDFSPAFRLVTAELSGPERLTVNARDAVALLSLRSEIELTPSGVLRLRHTLRNEGAGPYRLDELACVLPVPPPAREVLDLTGRWCRERHPQRRELGLGTWLRETRHGRTGHDASLLLVAGTPGFGFRSGEVWGTHLGWSGDAATWAERLPDGHGMLGAAELLAPGEIVLARGEEYTTPWLYAVWSDRGLDGLSAALHHWQRARDDHPQPPRPVVLNTWEAAPIPGGCSACPDGRRPSGAASRSSTSCTPTPTPTCSSASTRCWRSTTSASSSGTTTATSSRCGHGGRAAVHAQTLALYRLLDELRARHPEVEIESCASGGGRVDLGILERTDRVWASDTNDALERQAIQRWTGLLLAPELIGAHVGPRRAHTTGRSHALSFRVATALFGHFGLEWDINAATAEEQDGLAEAIAFYKRARDLLHGGEVVRADHHDPAAWVHGVVAEDGEAAVFAYVQLASRATEVPGVARLPGLRPEREYRVQPVTLAGGPLTQQVIGPPWLDAGGVTLSGLALATTGLQMPVLAPEQALLLELS